MPRCSSGILQKMMFPPSAIDYQANMDLGWGNDNALNCTDKVTYLCVTCDMKDKHDRQINSPSMDEINRLLQTLFHVK